MTTRHIASPVAASRTLRAQLEAAERVALYNPDKAAQDGALEWLRNVAEWTPPFPPAFAPKARP